MSRPLMIDKRRNVDDVYANDEEEKEQHGKIVAKIIMEDVSSPTDRKGPGSKGLNNLSMMSPSHDTSMASISMASVSMGQVDSDDN